MREAPKASLDSSVGKEIDCRSIGRLFDSDSRDDSSQYVRMYCKIMPDVGGLGLQKEKIYYEEQLETLAVRLIKKKTKKRSWKYWNPKQGESIQLKKLRV